MIKNRLSNLIQKYITYYIGDTIYFIPYRDHNDDLISFCWFNKKNEIMFMNPSFGKRIIVDPTLFYSVDDMFSITDRSYIEHEIINWFNSHQDHFNIRYDYMNVIVANLNQVGKQVCKSKINYKIINL